MFNSEVPCTDLSRLGMDVLAAWRVRSITKGVLNPQRQTSPGPILALQTLSDNLRTVSISTCLDLLAYNKERTVTTTGAVLTRMTSSVGKPLVQCPAHSSAQSLSRVRLFATP